MAFISTKKTFFAAAASGDLDELKYGLDENKYSINMQDREGNTALHIAAVNGQTEALKFLLARKPDLEIQNTLNQTPLLAAAMADKSVAALALLNAGANANAHNATYTYALHPASGNGDLDLVTALVTAGAILDVRTKGEERTPVYNAVANDRGAVLEFLVSKGARTDIPGNDNKTPYDLAKEDKPRLKKIIDAANGIVTPEPKPVPPPTVVEKPLAAAPIANDSAPPKIEGGVEWKLASDTSVVKISTIPALGRKLTEIFNFETRERMTLSENLKTGAETMGLAEAFNNLSEEALGTAAAQLRILGGKMPEGANALPASQAHIAKLRA